jgi:hypothetical protein
MGGRITEMFDFLNRDPPLTKEERRIVYGSFAPSEEDVKKRNKIRRERRKKGEDNEQRTSTDKDG